MAIKANYMANRGLLLTDQYIRVDRVIVTNKKTLDIEVGIYQSAEMAQKGLPPPIIDNFYGEYDIYDLKCNIWEHAYIIIKQQFSDAIDC